MVKVAETPVEKDSNKKILQGSPFTKIPMSECFHQKPCLFLNSFHREKFLLERLLIGKGCRSVGVNRTETGSKWKGCFFGEVPIHL